MKPHRRYRPSNGTEGEGFMENHCYQCIHENPGTEKNPKCDIMTAAMCYGIDEAKYPEEWVYDENDRPTCTKFVKWDWNNDGDPDDPDNPKAPVPEDPNQLCLPFIFDEIEQNTKTTPRTAHDRGWSILELKMNDMKAKERVKELMESFDNVDRQGRAEMATELKPQINTLLHTYLPDDMTLKETEAIAMVIFDMIYNPYDYTRWIQTQTP